MTMIAGVVGWPIDQSLSPLIHGAWIEAAEIEARYDPFGPQDAAAFAALVAEGRAGRLRGLNVTAPYKEQALALADEAGPEAAVCGSANLLTFEGGRLRADSTDGEGLLAALAEQAPALTLEGAETVVLGAGGAARAAAAALIGAGARVGLLNRTRARAEIVARDLGAEVVEEDALGRAALVVNALSVPPRLDLDRLLAVGVVMDMTYRPLETPLLASARARGLTPVDGLAMLIGQARPSFEALFGRPVPPIDVRALALAHLGVVQ